LELGMKNRREHESGRRWRHVLPGLLLLASCLPAGAQVYKWTDAQGTVHYTDTPPPQQRASQLKPPSPGDAGQSALPYELARAVKANPVTLYTTTRPACAGCDQGRALLRERGIPYTEKTVDTDEDKEQLRQLSGNMELPLLVVGNRKLTGFHDASWQAALSAAAYPRSAQLPSGYQFAAPQSAATAAAAASVPTPPARAPGAAAPNDAAAQAAEQQPRRPAARDTPATPKPPTGNAPPGFQF
jgi:glutaredoxin